MRERGGEWQSIYLLACRHVGWQLTGVHCDYGTACPPLGIHGNNGGMESICRHAHNNPCGIMTGCIDHRGDYSNAPLQCHHYSYPLIKLLSLFIVTCWKKVQVLLCI